MIKFLCDMCGKDVSDKVLDSVKQFCAKSYFKQGHQPKEAPLQIGKWGFPAEGEEHLQLDLQLLEQLSKLIHASAWNMNTTAIYCSNCAVQHADRTTGRVVTMFTRVSAEHCAA